MPIATRTRIHPLTLSAAIRETTVYSTTIYYRILSALMLSLEGHKFIDLEVAADFLDKARSIVQGLDYDTRVQIEVETLVFH